MTETMSSGYKCPIWEVIDIFQKAILCGIPIFVPRHTCPSLQGAAGQLVLIGSIILLTYIRPFLQPQDNMLQMMSYTGEAVAMSSL